MTVVVAWREMALDRVWVVSDSRLSSQGHTASVLLTDAAAKILSIPIVMRRQTPQHVFGVPVLSTQFGFAYAGSSLIAMQVYAAVLPLWSHLMTIGEEVLPPIAAFAEHLGVFLKAYAREVSSAHNAFQPCQCAIIGFDPSGDIEGWMAETVMDTEIEVRISKLPLDAGELTIFGSGAAEVRQELEIQRRPDGLWHREPLKVMRAHLAANPPQSVGGGVQLGFVHSHGFELMYDVQSIQPGNPIAAMRFRGFDFSEIGTVGPAFINLSGLA